VHAAGETGLARSFRERISQESLAYEMRPIDTLAALDPASTDLICLAVPAAGAEAVAFVRSVRQWAPQKPCLVLTAGQDPMDVYRLLEAGVCDFLTSPFRDHDVLPRLWRCLLRPVPGEGEELIAGLGLIGRSPVFRDAVMRLPQVAACGAGVLISGETGTGKELFARALHKLSWRAHGPFVPVNCGAVPLELVENELFGHDKGAYTGAAESRPGLIAEASGGTLFLDEIDSLPLVAQVKLLRFLQEKEYRPLGSGKARRADVRVIAASNLDILRAVQEGRLRQDLYYRLNVVDIALPPLRARREDIPVLARYFLRKFGAQFGKTFTGLTAEAQQRLLTYEWPGNVRELEHLIERAAALAAGPEIDAAGLSLPGVIADQPRSFRQAKAQAVKEFERVYLEGLLLACEGNISRAAAVAQKDRRAFFELIRKHQIDVRVYRSR
jgi:DNA-binding NtrC family response regulator